MVLAGAGLALCLGAPRAARGEDWPGFNLAPGAGRLSAERSGPAFKPGWQHALGPDRQSIYRALLASPAVGDGHVALGSYGDVIEVLRETDGRPIAHATVPGPIHASPAIWRGWLFVPSIDLTLYALRLTDGDLVWKTPLPGMGFAAPVVSEGRVYIATADPAPRLVCLEAETGQVVWQAGREQLKQGSRAAPVMAGMNVLVADGGRLHAFASADGTWQWTADLGGNINTSSPVVLGDRVYVLPGDDHAVLHALALATGTPLPGWPVELTAPPPTTAPPTGVLLGREHVFSSLAGAAGLLAFTWRIDERYASNGDGNPDDFRSSEVLVGVNPESGQARFTASLGLVRTSDPNRIPLHAFTGSPALYRSGAAATPETVLVATTSSLEPRVLVFDGFSGAVRWSAALAGPTRSSPVFANGRLLVATDAGTVHSFVSERNRPPVVGQLGYAPTDGVEVDSATVTLRWGTAVDPEMEPVSYELRFDDDGEVLHDWALSKTTSASELALGKLTPGRTYTWAVRARDAAGALSDWSPPATFRAVGSPDIEVGGEKVASLDDALARAAAGTLIRLGPGTFALTRPLALPAGVSLRGAAPHLTVLSARGLDAGIIPGAGAVVQQLTVARARVGIAVLDRDVVLANLILRDNERAGLEVGPAGSATLLSTTVTRNGTGVQSLGRAVVRNALVTDNDVGLAVGEAGLLESRFNNLVGNRIRDYEGRLADPTDLGLAVAFAGDPGELRLAPAQPTTDRGDPADDFANEPEPNGGRINIGAFGNTAFAELSAPATDAGQPSAAGAGCGCHLAGGAFPGQGPVVLLALGLAWAASAGRAWHSRRRLRGAGQSGPTRTRH
jgi:outer membrane protein assembly factor BamB